MSTANLLVKILAYSDASATYDPQLEDVNWTKEIEDLISGNFDTLTRTLEPGDTAIELPATTITFLYIEVDGTVYARLNGDLGDTNIITPSAVGTRDGVYLKRGNITDIVINNPGTANVTAKIFMGA